MKKKNKILRVLKSTMFLGFVSGFFVALLFYLFANWFNARYYLQSPIILRSPIEHRFVSPVSDVKIIEKDATESAVLTPTATPSPKKVSKADIVKLSKYPDFIDHIWERESGRGTAPVGLNSYCENKGMSNEFGFYPSGKHCFATFEASVRRLERWYEENKGLTDNQKLCRYNLGTASNSCAYLTLNFKEMN